MLDNTEDRLTHLPKSPRHVPLISILHPPVKVDPSQRRKVPDILPVFPTKWDFRTQTLSEVYRHCNCTEWTQVANGHSCSGNLRLACCPNPGSRQKCRGPPVLCQRCMLTPASLVPPFGSQHFDITDPSPKVSPNCHGLVEFRSSLGALCLIIGWSRLPN